MRFGSAAATPGGLGRSVKRAGLAGLVAATLVVAGPAHAQNVDAAAAAEDLFQRGKALMTSKNVAEACPLFAESFRLDPAGGTLQNLALCYEELGKWASAYARFQELKVMSARATPPRADRIKLADEHVALLTPRLSRLFVTMPREGAPPGTRVKVDGVEYEPVSWRAGILVDPGDHEILVTAPGRKPFTSRETVTTEGARTLAIPTLREEPNAKPLSQPSEPAARSGTKTVGYVIGAVGLAALATGGTFALLSASANSSAKNKCSRADNPGASADDFDPTTGKCFTNSQPFNEASDRRSQAMTFANVANVLVPVGIVGAGVGLYLVLRPGANASPRARLSPTLTGLVVDGSF